MTSTSTTGAFFQQLEARGHEPALEKVTGTLRFDVVEGPRRVTRWLVSVKRGDIAVARGGGEADCVVRADAELFEGVARGRVNAFTAMLRGALHAEGDVALLVLFQRLFPDPPRRSGGGGGGPARRRKPARSRGRRPPRGSAA
jgi:hypothetical protein